jgi:hypothetical protein
MIDSTSKKPAGGGRKARTSLLASSEHIRTSKATSTVRRNTTIRRIASYNADGGRINNGGIRRRLVSFARDVQVVGEIPSRSDLSVEQFRDVWYTKDDFKTMKTAFVPTLKKMAKSLPLAEDEEPRGLEHKTPRGSKSRTDNRYQAMDLVLDEQERQWSQDRKDPEYMAKLYRQSSAHCQMNAYLVAQKDAEQVQQLWDEAKQETIVHIEAELKFTQGDADERRGVGTATDVKPFSECMTKGAGTPTRQKAARISVCGSHKEVLGQRILVPLTH